jgi:hypothetical protein
MPRAGLNQSNFSKGQYSQDYAGNYTSDQYLEGVELATNVIARPEGGLVKRPGTIDVPIPLLLGSTSVTVTSNVATFTLAASFANTVATGDLVSISVSGISALNVALAPATRLTSTTFSVPLIINLTNGSYVISSGTQLTNHSGIGYNARPVPFQFTNPGTGTVEVAWLYFRTDNRVLIIDPLLTPIMLDLGLGLGALSTSNIDKFNWLQVRSSIFLVAREFPPVQLTRDDSIPSWTLSSAYTPKDGPWEDANTNPNFKIRVVGFTTTDNGFTGTGTVRSVNKADTVLTPGWFLDAWVGRQLRINQTTTSPVEEKWGVVTINSISHNDTGAVCSGFNVTVDADYPLLKVHSGTPGSSSTKNWQLSAWYANNYPTEIAYHQGRLWFFRDDYRWSTKVGDLNVFSPNEPAADDRSYVTTNASAIAIHSIEPDFNQVRWAVSYNALHLGTLQGGQVIQGANKESAITPSTVSILTQHQQGTSTIRPVVSKYLYFLDSTTTRLFRLEFDYVNDAYLPVEITETNRDILYPGAVHMALVTYPFKMLWVTLKDGTIAVCSMDEAEKNFGWTKISLASDKAKWVYRVVQAQEFPNKEYIFVGTKSGKLIRFGDILPKSGVAPTTETLNASAPFQTTNNLTIEEYVVDNAVLNTAGPGLLYDLSTLPIGHQLIDTTTYQAWNKTTSTTNITPANNYQTGFPIIPTMRLRPLDVITAQGSSLKDTKEGKRIFFSLSRSSNFKIKEVKINTWTDVSVKPNPSDPLFSGLFEMDNFNTDVGSILRIEISQDFSTPFQLNSVHVDTNIVEIT